MSARFRPPSAAPPEDPRVVLERASAEQLVLLQQARRGLADVATARARVAQQAEELQRQVEGLQHQAEQAVAAGHDDLALDALERQGRLAQQHAELVRQGTELGSQEQDLRGSVEALAGRVEELRVRTEMLAAQHAAAVAQATISGALGDVRAQVSADLALQAVEDLTLARRAEAAALGDVATPATDGPATDGPARSAQEALARLTAQRSPAAAPDDSPDTGGAAQ